MCQLQNIIILNLALFILSNCLVKADQEREERQVSFEGTIIFLFPLLQLQIDLASFSLRSTFI